VTHSRPCALSSGMQCDRGRSLHLWAAPQEWNEDGAALRAWQKGRTGFPLVDAGMRQLWRTGWMQQSIRMVCAAFLTEYLNIHWVHGARSACLAAWTLLLAAPPPLPSLMGTAFDALPTAVRWRHSSCSCGCPGACLHVWSFQQPPALFLVCCLKVVPRHAGRWRPGHKLDDVAECWQERLGPVELHSAPHKLLAGRRTLTPGNQTACHSHVTGCDIVLAAACILA
jgi:hypothetical protein